jgi:hypothetical protein
LSCPGKWSRRVHTDTLPWGEWEKEPQEGLLDTSVLPKRDCQSISCQIIVSQTIVRIHLLLFFESHYRRPEVTRRRAHVTQMRNMPVEKWSKSF